MHLSTLAAREVFNGWVIDATRADGRVEQLIGVFYSETVAENWIAQHPQAWWRVYKD